jgi:hypothetical protein
MPPGSGNAGLAREAKDGDLKTRKLKRLHITKKPATTHLDAELVK